MRRLFQTFSDRRDGSVATEFAVIAPVLFIAYLGGYQICEGISAYRKTTITTRTVVDLAAQYTKMSNADFTNVLNASAQVMTPFDTSSISIILTEYATSSAGVTTVTWSRVLNGSGVPAASQVTALTAGSRVTLPQYVCQNGASVLYGQVTYKYTPVVGYGTKQSLAMRDQIYMSPRSVSSIPYTGS